MSFSKYLDNTNSSSVTSFHILLESTKYLSCYDMARKRLKVFCLSSKQFSFKKMNFFKFEPFVRTVSKASSNKRGKEVKVYVIYMQNVISIFSFWIKWDTTKKRRCFISLADDKLRKMFHLNVFFFKRQKRLKSWRREKKIMFLREWKI